MRVILLRDQVHLGKRGEVVEVKQGFARNYLLPQGVALEATPGNMKLFEQQKRKIEARHVQEVEAAQGVKSQLDGLQITIPKRVGESETLYGSVTAGEIEEALLAKGIEVDKRRIDLEGGIKSLGNHPVRLHLHPEVVAEITVTVVAEE